MRRGVLAMVLATVVAAMTASTSAARTLLSVRPGRGGARTTFVVRFRHPDQTGRDGGVRRTDSISLSGTGAGSRCVSASSRTLAPEAAGQIATVKLRPGHSSHRWCSGRFRGVIRETTTIVCPEVHPLCPIPAPISRTIARFSFRVRGHGSQTGGGGSQNGGPTFGGLISATTCMVLTPQLPIAVRTYSLTWDAATDPTTPSSAIVYDIYYSPTPGGEDYSTPTFTTSPGATTYEATVKAGPAYFVVRARDQAGREDDNRVQRPGVSICGATPTS